MKHVSVKDNSLDNADFKYVQKISLSFAVDEIIVKNVSVLCNGIIQEKIENL